MILFNEADPDSCPLLSFVCPDALASSDPAASDPISGKVRCSKPKENAQLVWKNVPALAFS